MVINLTESGWNEDGNLLGEWSNGTDNVFGNDTIDLAAGVTVDTLNGSDLISNDSDSGGLTIGDNATLNTNDGSDRSYL